MNLDVWMQQKLDGVTEKRAAAPRDPVLAEMSLEEIEHHMQKLGMAIPFSEPAAPTPEDDDALLKKLAWADEMGRGMARQEKTAKPSNDIAKMLTNSIANTVSGTAKGAVSGTVGSATKSPRFWGGVLRDAGKKKLQRLGLLSKKASVRADILGVYLEKAAGLGFEARRALAAEAGQEMARIAQ